MLNVVSLPPDVTVVGGVPENTPLSKVSQL
jgi:hypothetical protein